MRQNWAIDTIYPLRSGQEVRLHNVQPFAKAPNSHLYGGMTGNGYGQSVLVKSIDNWNSVIPLVEMPMNAGYITSIHVVSGTEVLVGTSVGKIFRSVADFTTVTQALKMTTSGAYPRNWSFAGKGNLVFVGEYGWKNDANNARRVYMSQDGGATWAEVYQIVQQTNAHVHKLLLDPYTDALWVSNGDSPGNRALTKLEAPNYNVGTVVFNDIQPTDGIAFQDYILWCQDSGPYGVYKHNKADDTKTLVLDLATDYPEYADTAYTMVAGPNGAVYFATHPDVNPASKVGIWRAFPPHEEWEFIADCPYKIATMVAVDSDNKGVLMNNLKLSHWSKKLRA
jgi:hypothetical protein